MPSMAGGISIEGGRAGGSTTIEVVGPTSALTQKVAEVLEQHGRTGAASGKRIFGRERVYVVNALKPDGTTVPTAVRKAVRYVRAHQPNATVFVILDEANAEAVQAARQAGATDFVSEAAASNPAALEWRINTLLQRRAARSRGISLVGVEQKTSPLRKTTRSAPDLRVSLGASVEPTAAEVAKALTRVDAGLKRLPTLKQALSRAAKLTTVAMPELRDERSGRFDAKRIAERLGVSINRLAPATGVSQQALSKRPDSPRAQKGLAAIARVLAALDELHPARAAKMWLNAPRPQLDDTAPLELILQGRADAVARMLERALEGIPG